MNDKIVTKNKRIMNTDPINNTLYIGSSISKEGNETYPPYIIMTEMILIYIYRLVKAA